MLAWLKVQRIGLENLDHKGERSWFLTLTFKEVPPEGDGYDQVQLWLKRLRKSVGPVRFIMVSEFGPLRGRLHYHGIIWCKREVKYRELPKWTLGFSRYKVAVAGGWEYLVKYLSKGSGKVRASTELGCATIKRAEAHPMVHDVMEYFPGSRITAIGGYAVSERLSAAVASPPLIGEAYMIARMSRSIVLQSSTEEVQALEESLNDD